MRFRLVAFASVCLTLAACSADNTPCSRCPQLEGTYALQIPDTELSADCQALGVRFRSGDLALVQSGSELTGTFDGNTFAGLIYNTGDFTLHGAETNDGGTSTNTRNLRGVVGSGVYDGGVPNWTGTYLITVQDTPAFGTPRTCSLQSPVTATRQ